MTQRRQPTTTTTTMHQRQQLMQYARGTILCVWMTRHSRAWALNSFGWLKHPGHKPSTFEWTSIPGHKPSTVEWLTFQGISPQQCMSMNDSLCISTYNSTTTATTMTTTIVPNYLWHTPQLIQQRQDDINNGNQRYSIYNYIYLYIHAFT